MGELILPAGQMTDQQRTLDWYHQRKGRFTASTFGDVMARSLITGEYLKAHHDLVRHVAIERLTDMPVEGPSGFALQWGTDVEPFARDAYELYTGLEVTAVGFLIHPTMPFVGASPDGLIMDDGVLEMKCPKDPKVHADRFLTGMPKEYYAQMQGQMMVSGRQWGHFVSYDPRQTDRFKLYLEFVPRDDAFIAQLVKDLLQSEAEVQQAIALMDQRAIEMALAFEECRPPTPIPPPPKVAKEPKPKAPKKTGAKRAVLTP